MPPRARTRQHSDRMVRDHGFPVGQVQDRLLRILAAAEAVALQDILDAAIEAVELAVAGGGASAQAEQPVGRAESA